MSDSILTVTPAAILKLRTVKVGGRDASDSALRMRALEAGAHFRYEFSFVPVDVMEEMEASFETDGIRFCMDAESAPRLRGATLDFVDDLSGSGFKVENPNKTRLAANPLAERIQIVLDERINPGIAQHGGNVSLVAIEEDRVFVEFGGGCQGCGQADVTFKEGIVVALKDAFPEIAEVLDATDHEAGANPYY